MKILIIGGTQFVGRHIVMTALQQNHQITLLNRGTKNVFPELELLKADRNELTDLDQLKGRSWDIVIDTCAYFPRQVKHVLERLDTKHYTLISSISAYKHQDIAMQDETADLAELEDETVEEVTGETYGGLKVLCEQAAQQHPSNLIVRPGLIVGPYDHTDRFSYWPDRVAKGGEVLAPDKASNPVQFIDVRDLTEWILHAASQNLTGAYNLVNDPDSVNFGALLSSCKEVSQSNAMFTWLSEAFMLENDIGPWIELPLWVPGESVNFMRVNNAKARAAGLNIRPIADTIAATLAFLAERPEDHQPKAGLAPDKEKAILNLWSEASS